MQKGITGHLLDLVADLARHSYYRSQCWRGEQYSGALHARLWMLFKKVGGVWLCIGDYANVLIILDHFKCVTEVIGHKTLCICGYILELRTVSDEVPVLLSQRKSNV